MARIKPSLAREGYKSGSRFSGSAWVLALRFSLFPFTGMRKISRKEGPDDDSFAQKVLAAGIIERLRVW